MIEEMNEEERKSLSEKYIIYLLCAKWTHTQANHFLIRSCCHWNMHTYFYHLIWKLECTYIVHYTFYAYTVQYVCIYCIYTYNMFSSSEVSSLFTQITVFFESVLFSSSAWQNEKCMEKIIKAIYDQINEYLIRKKKL